MKELTLDKLGSATKSNIVYIVKNKVYLQRTAAL